MGRNRKANGGVVAYWCKKMPVRLYFDEPLTVPWLTGGTFSVILDPEDTVASLKSKIQLQTNIPITNQVLKLDGKELSDQPPPVNDNSKDEPWQSKEVHTHSPLTSRALSLPVVLLHRPGPSYDH